MGNVYSVLVTNGEFTTLLGYCIGALLMAGFCGVVICLAGAGFIWSLDWFERKRKAARTPDRLGQPQLREMADDRVFALWEDVSRESKRRADAGSEAPPVYDFVWSGGNGGYCTSV